MAIRDAPTNELGAPGIVSQSGWIWSFEQNPEVAWPASVVEFDAMRHDGHVASGLRAIKLPIRRTRWQVADSADVRPQVAAFVRTELGLTETQTGRRRRRRQGISWDEFLQHALFELDFGHMFFEQVYELGPPTDPIDGLTQVAHLRKLGPRMPRTIAGFDVARDGGLKGILQWVTDEKGIWREVPIPVDRLVGFVWEKEGSDWSGVSLLRDAFGHWKFKRDLMRIDGIGQERNSLGVPHGRYNPDKMTKTEALDIVRNFRTGEEAGVATEEGAFALDLLGVQGELRNPLESIRYHDQEIGRTMLAMFLDLGHDNGARSLGETFVDFFVLAEGALLAHLEETITEHVVRDLVEINFGPDEAYPEVVADEITAQSPLTAEAMKQLAEAGYVIPDDELEVWLRRRHGWPIRPGLPTGPPDAGQDRRDEIDQTPPAGQKPAELEPVPTAATLEELEERLAEVRDRRRARGVASRR